MIAKVSARGSVLIPVELRKKYKLHASARVVIVDYAGILTIVPAMSDPIRQARGMLKGGSSLLDALKLQKKLEHTSEKMKGSH